MHISPKHKYPIKEGFLTSWGVKSNKKPCRQHYGLATGIYSLPQGAYSVADKVDPSYLDLYLREKLKFGIIMKKNRVYYFLKFHSYPRPPYWVSIGHRHLLRLWLSRSYKAIFPTIC